MIPIVITKTREAAFVPSGTQDNSPPFQRWVTRCDQKREVPIRDESLFDRTIILTG